MFSMLGMVWSFNFYPQTMTDTPKTLSEESDRMKLARKLDEYEHHVFREYDDKTPIRLFKFEWRELMHNRDRIHQEHTTDLQRRIEELEWVLNDIAAWDEGEKVTGSFDCPYHAELAREALSTSLLDA